MPDRRGSPWLLTYAGHFGELGRAVVGPGILDVEEGLVQPRTDRIQPVRR